MQPYKFSIVKNNYYEFTTQAGTKYACYFLSYANYFTEYKEIANKIYAFNIDILVKVSKAVIDPRIGYTIVKIIRTFLEGLQNAVVYVCDTSDSQELMRKRKFDAWFRQHDDGTINRLVI
ncbi:MAG: hypothetical protein IPJ81_07545 [Chitinophagaceae bacterium]|nr:hypothetical protein [Chitinophagaceae bacterium]